MGLIKDIKSLSNDYMKVTQGYFMFKYMKNFYCIHEDDFEDFIERISKDDVNRLNVICKYFEKHSDESDKSSSSGESSDSESEESSDKSDESDKTSSEESSDDDDSEHSSDDSDSDE
jgi:hypothetical protein